MKTSIWVAGFGNGHRQDDGAGVLLAQRIHTFLNEETGATCKLCLEHQLLPELAEEMSGMDWAIFCDADTTAHDGGFAIQTLEPQVRLEGFNIHSMGPAWLLALSQSLGTSPKQALLVTVSGDAFDFSDTPTEACMERIERAEAAFRDYWRVHESRTSG